MLSVKSSRKIQTSLFIVFLMVSMTWSAGINEIVSKYEPKSELPDAPVVVETSGNVGCESATRTAGTPIYVDPVVGSNTWAGTSACPKASLEDALSISIAGDEIILNSGLYHENVTVNNKDDLLIRAADGAKVVFDGTRSIAEDFGAVWSAADGNGIQEVDLPQAGWQLFLAYEEQVPARWPNAAFDDETVFNRSYWAEGTLTSNNNAYTQGWLTDAGPEAGVHTGLNETINATGLDPVGAIAILNLGSFRSNSREITGWNSANGTFSYDSSGVSWKNKHHAYFLEGKRELIDIDGEWWFDNANSRLHYKTPGGQDANDLDLRVKVQPFAISVDNSDRVTIQGIDFFGTTVNFNNCDRCSFTNSTLEYPSTSKRGLGIAGESEDDRWMTRFYRCTNTFVDRISITNTDGGALEFHGSGGQSNNNIVNNSYFHAIDWTAADQKGLMTTIYEGGRDMYFTNNSVHLTGASSVLSIGDAPKVFYNDVWDVGHLQSDGAVVQVMQGEAPGAEIAYNWIHDIIKYGARFDAPIGEVGDGRNGTMHHNVIWNAAGGLMVKGDYHDIHNNTVFNSTGKNDIIFLTDGGINNKNSTLHYNAVDAMADHRSDDIFANPIPYGTDWMNWNGYIQGKQGAVTTLNGEVSGAGDVGSTCIINSTKSLLCWGSNANGRLGLGNTTDQYSPVAVTFPNGGTVEKVADSGGYPLHNCAIMTNGSLYCWGKNSDGQLGIGSTTQQTTPQLVNLGSGVKAVDVSVGTSFTCAVTDAGALMCWGANDYGKLGIGSAGSSYSTPQNPSLPTNRKAVDVQLGHSHGCALLDNGDVACWGYNGFGGLGTGNTNQITSPTVVSLDSQRQVASIGTGKHHTCIGYDNGSVVCAGRDNHGQQGTYSASNVNHLTFSYTNALANLSIIAFAGEYVSCALLANGTAQCWGYGINGQMGDGTPYTKWQPSTPVNTPSGRFIVDMSISGQHACSVLDDGSVACWGNNNKGQLGLGNTTQQNQPVVLTGLDDLSTTSVHEMLADPANNDFRPKWGSHLHVLNAGAYDADDSNPWTAGISWTYTTPNAPVAGCMLDYADNYDADAIVPDGSCLFSSYTPPSTLDLRLHLDPTNSSSYSGSGTNVADLSGFNNNGTVAAAGPTWDADFTRFTYDGACTGSSGNYVCDEIEIEDSETLRPGEPYEDLAVELNTGSTTQYLTAPSSPAGNTLGAVETSFTIQAWVKPTDCAPSTGVSTIVSKVYSFKIGCEDGTWHYILGDGTAWYTVNWVDTGVPVDNNAWQHVALTRASSITGVKFFLNGVQSYSVSSYEGDLGNNNAELLYVGSRSGQYATSDAWHGLIDDVRIYTSDRSSTIADDMNRYPNVNDDYLNAYFDFNFERHRDTVTSVPNLATGAEASSASLTSVTGSPQVVRIWDVSTVGSDTVLTFERTVLTAQGGWRVPTSVSSADVLIVGGGGGGGYNTGGGGGGGGVGFFNSTELPSGSFVPVVVGQGGMGATTSGGNGTNGQPSQLRTSIVGGGGGGAGWLSGGGNGVDAPTGSPVFAQNGSGGGGAHTDGQGGTGATNGGDAALNAGGGGGGAGADGSPVTVNQAGADGGAGLASSISGSNLTYGSGAGGGGWTGAGSGGSGAGNGGRNYAATDGTANRGGGGGGGGNSGDELGGNGGSGVVIVRYASVDHNDWSVATWFNASSLQGSTIIGTYNDDGQPSDIGWALRIRAANGNLYSTVGTTTNNSAAWTSDASINTDRWYHVVMVADVGNTLRLYLDGVNVANGSLSGSGKFRDVSNNVFLGSYNGGEEEQPFDGQIGSVMVFADALDANNINQLYTAGKGVYSNTTNLSYAQSSSTLIFGQAYSFPLTVTNGEVTTSYSLSGTLPTGMNFESSNGTIWGTPTAGMTSTTYTVTANNSAGSYSASISLTSQDVAPYDLAYSPENMTLTKGTAMTTNTPSVSGGTITSWEISPSLPSGLAFSTSTGAISGTATVLQTIATTYTIWANNSGGSASATVNITINDEAPDVAYSPDWFVLTNNTAMQATTPTNSGGAIPSAFFGYTGDAKATSIAVDSYGHKHVSYRDSSGLMYATDTSGSWVTVTVDSVAAGWDGIISIAIDSNDVLHISYFDGSSADLKYATCSSACTTASNWNKVSVDTTGSVGHYLSMAIDSNGALHISYFDDTNKDLKYATCSSGCTTASNWNKVSVDTTGSVGYFTSIALDSNDALHISYVDVTNDDLKYATCSSDCTTASNWNTVSVDSFGSSVYNPEVRTDLAIDSNDGVHLSYFDNTNDDLKYATCSNGCTTASNWNKVSVDTTGDVGYSASIGIDSNDVLHISYSDKTNNNLKYAICSSGCTTASNWNNETVDSSSALTGEYTSIAIDANDFIHISYFDDTSNKIRYLAMDSSSNILGYSVSPDLPTGLRLDPMIGKISGTPTELSTNTTYTITVRNSGGVNTTTITMLVNDQVPNALGYTPENMTLEKGTTMTTNTPSVSGGAVTSWEISPSLPTGLSFGSTNGSIWGTPTVLQTTAVEYTVWANNSGGSESAQVNITINDMVPNALSYSPENMILEKGTVMVTNTPSVSGGAVTSWEIDPSLPNGLSFGSTNGSIWGTPTIVQSTAVEYTVWANNSGGSSSATVNITINDLVPNTLGYAPENMTLEKGTTMTTNAPSVSGGAVTSWEISPSLPTGLSFGSTNGSIWGTPTIVQSTAVEYTVWANNSGGSTSATVNITVNDVAPSISYSLNDITATLGVPINPHSNPTNTGGAVTSWEISPDPGPAFHFNEVNGVISGTPGILLIRTEYTIYANNSGGSSVAYVNVTINDVPPNTIIYSPHTMTLEKDTAMSPVTPTVSGGPVSTWEIAPDLPSGLSLDSATGTISGTPTVLQLNSVAYTVWANNTGGSASTTVNIAINDQVATISYSTPVEISNDRALSSTITPTISGGAVTSWEISPSLPTGLIFGTTNGSIWGTPVGVESDESYTIWGNNSGGSAQATLTLTIVWTLTPTVEGVNATRNTTLADDIQWTWDYEPLEAQSISLVTGDYNTCSIRADSDIYCWGRNGNGQLGYGSSSDLGCGNHNDACKDRPRETIDLGSDVVSIAFGDRHACGLTDTGIVKCWGRNNHGQIGTPGGDKSSPQPVSFGSGLTATSIYAGGHHTCAILSDGSVKCWGRNEFGQLGIGTTINTNTPTTVNTLGAGRSAISLALAWDSTCALLDDGSVKCWGKREHGQLGDGSSTGQISSPPSNAISFGAGRTAKMITAGEFHYCAILDNDEIMCWGDGANGKLATGSTADQTTPTAPSGSFAAGRYAVYLDAGYHHTCAILDNGQATCWGSDANGQLGNGVTTGDILSLHTGFFGWNAMAISAGGSHTCMQVDKPGDNNQHERIKCWGNRGSGQLGDNSNFASSNSVSPQSVYGGFTALNTGITAPNYVNGATCEISPSLPAGLTLTPGDCSITGTPTVTAVNTTYTVWANITGQSFSGQFYLEVGLNVPIISYPQSFYTFTIDATIAEIQPTNTGGEVTTWEIDPQSLPSGVNFGSANGTFWGTPTALETLSSHTVWANNSAGSDSFSISFSVIDNPPVISYSETAITIVANAAMTPLPVINTGGAIVSCSASPSLPNGLSLSNTCELSGTPTAPSPLTPYTITATNTGGSDSTSISITVQNSGGTLTITPTNTEGSVNSTISDITMSYTHTASNYAWTSGVTTSTTTLTTDWEFFSSGSYNSLYNDLEVTHLLSTDIGPNGEQAIAFSRNVSSHFVLALMYEWNGVWTETIIDNNPNSAHHPSIAIDKFGAIHIAYIDSDNDILRYATNTSGQWVLTTLGSATYDNDDHRGTAIVIHPVTNAVHIVTSTNDNTYRDLVHHTNETGSWVNTTITNTLSDEGHDPSMAMDSDGNIYVAYYCDNGCSDLRMSSRINGVWQNETIAGNVASSGSDWNVGAQSDIAIDSQDTIHIVSNYVNNRRVYLHSGTPGSWTQTQLTSGSTSWWPTIAIDSNDVLHVAYHKEAPNRALMYMTNASGSWSTPIAVDNNWGGWGSEMVIDQNDDLFIVHAGANVNGVIYDYLKVTTVQGTGQGLTPRPIFNISPPLPNGLNMNWRSGTITGTPTEVHANTTHTVTVTALGLTTTATFTLLITGAPGDIAYSDISGSIQAPINPTTPTFTNTSTSGLISTWEIDPSLPTGMNFGSNNGTIWGTPTVVVPGDVFTIWANNSVGSKSTTVAITIDDLSVSAINYASENFTLTYYHTMTAATPSTTGGTATSWSIHPSLPTGLSLDAATGEISGRPEVLQTTAVTYTVWANNSGGTFSDQINITINDHSPAPINYLTDELNLVVNQSVVSVSDFEIRPDLLAAGEDHTCAIDADGAVWCWGTGTSGELGTGQTVNRWQPFNTASLGVGRTAIDITAGGDHTCAVLDDGTVSCWGANAYGQLGDGTNTLRSSPTQTLPLGRPAVAVEASMFSTCALLDNGSVSCWGRNHQGQLGRGFSNLSNHTFPNPPALTLPMPGGLKVVAIDISHYMKCGVLEDGSIACWGQYGGGNTPSLETFFGAANPARDVATGKTSACALMRNGSVNCWGQGFLGTGGAGQTANPGAIWPNLGAGRTAVQIELGRFHNCAILDDASVKCWGKDNYAQMGNGAGENNALTPSSVSFASGRVARDIIAGHWHTCAAMQTNEIYCWGDGNNGKLGDGSANNNQDPDKTMHFDSANPAKAHGDITSWEINASLPTGLTFGGNNGTIYGTATELWTQTSYTIWANNSGGSSVAYFNITVVDEVPTFSYSPDDITLTNNTASSDFPLAPTLTGAGVITSWEINASLPSGVSFGSNNGTIYGTPTELWTQTAYLVWGNNSGGSTVAYLNITVVDQLPSISYSPDELILTNNTASSDFPLAPTLTGAGVITSWEINASLPSGVSFGSNNGTIYGTPTELWPQTAYRVWANNSGGSSVAYLNITVVDEIPMISYSPENLILTKNAASTDLPLSPTLAGSGTITSWEISQSLPAGLNFGSSNGTIWGTPTSLQTVPITYTIYANNSGGSASANINITINDELPNIAYSPDWFELTKDTAMSPTAIPTNTGGAIPSAVVASGTVAWYTSIAVDSYGFKHISYHVDSGKDLFYATDKTGTWTVTLIDSHSNGYTSIAIDSNDNIHISYYKNANGGELTYTTCSSSCSSALSWTSTVVDSGQNFFDHQITIDANNALHISYYDGSNYDLKYAKCSSSCSSTSSWTTLLIDSDGQVGSGNSLAVDSNNNPHISYYDFINQNLKYATCSSSCELISSWTNTTLDTTGNSGSDTSIAIDSNDNIHIAYTGQFVINVNSLKYATDESGSWLYSTIETGTPSMSSGIENSIAIDSNDNIHISYYNSANGLNYATDYTGTWVISTLDNPRFSSTRYTDIAIDSGDKIHISYSATGVSEVRYAMVDSTSNLYGYSISPNLPAGLNFNPATGEISGTPTAISANTTYTITATNSGGSSTTTITIVVNDVAPSDLVYSVENMSLMKNQAMTPNTATVNGAITSWEISPSLPTGLSFGSSNGTIWGTPTVVQLTPITYTVWANNTGGSVSVTLNITIADDLAVFSYPNSPYTIVRGYNISDITPTVTSGTVVSWGIHPSLPSGLSFTSGVISGKPTGNQTITTYTVYANNSGGSATATLQLTINEPTPNVDYNPDNYTMTNGSSYTISPILLGQPGEAPPVIGYPDSWSISPSLPAGLDFGTDNGTVWGMPTVLQITPVMYTITATNANGSSSTTINLTIIDVPPGTITYSPHDMILTKNELMTPNVPTIGGEITSWETYPTNLPPGLNFGANNGTIWGTPSIILVSPVTYTIWANNSGGSSTTTVNITINDQAPAISYSPDYYVFTINDTISPSISPTVTGGAITTWTINATLPAGVFFGPNNGTIYGVAGQLWPQHTYLITASNSGGASSDYLNITIIDELPTSISYPVVNLNLTNNTASPDLPMTPQIQGPGTIVTWEISAALPSGLFFNVNTGEISGIATELWPTTNYTVWANNSGGAIAIEFNITVVDQVPTDVAYNPSDLQLVNNTVSTDLPLIPQLNGPGEITSWELNATLPSGLNFGGNNGTIWGTPTELWPTTAYQVWANNTGGSVSGYLNITVVDQIPILSYSPDALELTNNTASLDLPLIPQLTGPGEITSWEINATLPNGILFGGNNGTIWGTPTELWPTTSYTVWANNTGGSSSATLTITVVDQVPTDVFYSPFNLNLINNTASSDLPLSPQITGPGEITSWEINATLPNGILFGGNNGTIWGTPTELWPITSYTIWANNSGGSVSTEINITVVDQVPSLAYNPSDLQLMNNTASVDLPLLPQLSGAGEILTWEINATLPSGISFGSNNGTFWGTPTELWPTTAYKVWANNTGGSAEAYLNITVVDQIPMLSYSPDVLELTNNTASSDLPLAPTLSGAGVITSWEINATLPSGLAFGSNNGTIYGIPTELWPATDYTVWANNSGGSVSTILTITVVDQVPNTIVYPVINLNLTNNTGSADLPMIPQITGPGAIISWEISGAIPQGLSFDSNTGIISGIPTELWPTTNYTVWANNTGGSVAIEFNITVVDQLPTTFTYNPSDLLLSNNTASSDLPLAPQLAGPGLITSWAINETLPSGLQFGTNNGTIWGIPTEIQLTPKPFNITASNSGGTIYAIINITIVEATPTLDYDPDNYTFIRNTTITDIVPIYTPLDLIDTWEISPALPNGLTLDNGTISGTPTVNMTITEFTVWANNTGGSASANINITIVEPTGSFAYMPDDVNLTRGQGISPMSPNYNGGAIENWSIHPQLPAGLIFDNGTISGTPTVNSTKVNYTVYANNSGGSVTAIISITINEPVASIIYVPDERNETRTISMTPWFPQVTGGEVETWEIYPALPNGLTFVDGIISGTATVNSTRTTYTVWANNTGGSASTMINLTVVEPVVQLSYPNYELILVRDTTMASLIPQLSGGEAETWEIYPDLPAGINFTDGMIWGTPAVNSTRTMYTVYANNTGGSTNVSLNITILEPSANIIYDPVNLFLTRGEAMEPAIPDTDGGAIEEWGIHPELPDGLIFDNGTIYGTPTVNMTITNYIIYGNNSGGSSIAGLSITVLEPAPTITYLTDYLVLTRGEAMTSPLHAIFGGGAVASFTVTPDLPDGLNFTNGTIFGTPTVNSTIVEYNISAINNGGSDYFLLNITILEPVANLSAEQTYFELTRGEDEMNLTLNNTGGMVAIWEIAPELPAGLIFGNGTITGTPTVNASLATYTIWANNTGGSDSILVNIRVLEPAANISYRRSDFTLINGQDNLYIAPDLLGGNPETWEFEPELPAGITFSNGVFSGVPKDNLTTTTFTVWANNSGGSATATITLTVDQPFFVVRYPVTILVLNISEVMPVLAPVYYFDETSNPIWSVQPALPDGLIFDNGNISGIPTTPQPLTSYNVTVTGDLVPFTFEIMIEIRDAYVDPVIEDQRNETQMEAEPPETEFPEPEEESIAFWLCPLILIISLWLTAMLYNAKKKNDDVEIA